MSTVTSSECYHVAYEWIIQDFLDYLDFYQNARNPYNLYSSNFPSFGNYKNIFFLSLRFHENKHLYQDWIGLHLHWNKCYKPARVRFILYMLKNKKERHNEMNFNIDLNHRMQICGTGMYYGKKILLCKAMELMPNNNLTLGCEIIIYEKPVDMLPYYKTSFHHLFRTQFSQLLDDESCSDITFHVSGQQFKAHKLILKCRSPVFKAMLLESESVDNNEITTQTNITIPDIRPEIFQMILEFIYMDDIRYCHTSRDDAVELLEAAEIYQLEDLKNLCGRLIFNGINITNAMETLTLAERHHMELFAKTVIKFIKVNKNKVLHNIDPEYFENNGNHMILFI